MSIKHLRTLVAVADHETFSAAADAVCLTHAAVSQQMRALEEDMGLTLFDRSTRTPRLNATGLALVGKARTLLRDYENLVPSILNEDYLAGEISLGAVPTTFTGLVPAGMTILKQANPDLRVRLRPGLTARLISDLKRNLLEGAILTKPVVLPPDLEFLEIAREPLFVIAAEHAPDSDPIALLGTQPFIRFNRDAVVGTQIESWIQANRIPVVETMELDSLEAISSMVYADLGVSILPKSCVAPFNPLPVKWLPLGPEAPARILGLAFRRDSPKARAMQDVHAALLKAVAQSHPDRDNTDGQ